jgi:hypothetical protein
MRPPTHDDPNAIPRNGTEVPWLDLDDPGRTRDRAAQRRGAPEDAAAHEARRRR